MTLSGRGGKRQGAGQPEKPPTKQARIPLAALEKVQAIVKAEKKAGHSSSASDLIGELIEIGLKKYTPKN